MTTIVTDAVTITRRDLLHWTRNPSVIVASVTFPVMFVLLFGFVFGGQPRQRRHRPAAFHARLPRVGADGAQCGRPRQFVPRSGGARRAGAARWSANGGVAGALLTVSHEAAGLAWAPLFPLTMVANTFVAPSQVPGWLGVVADWNPLSATVTAIRQLFGNHVPELAGTSWPAQHAMLLAVLWPLLIVAVFAPLAIRRHTRG